MQNAYNEQWATIFREWSVLMSNLTNNNLFMTNNPLWFFQQANPWIKVWNNYLQDVTNLSVGGSSKEKTIKSLETLIWKRDAAQMFIDNGIPDADTMRIYKHFRSKVAKSTISHFIESMKKVKKIFDEEASGGLLSSDGYNSIKARLEKYDIDFSAEELISISLDTGIII